jgi:hypothetical protein
MRDIPGYEGLYAITKGGRIWSYKRNTPHLHRGGRQGTIAIGGRFLNPHVDNVGYFAIALFKDNKQTSCRIHRLVARTYVPNPENKSQINHINGVKTDNRIENLEWCTHQENVTHAWKTGLKKSHVGQKGSSNSRALLTEKEVLEIRAKYPQFTLGKLGEHYHVSLHTIWDIVQRRHWTHI